MARPLTARMSAALHRGAPICLLAEIDHPDGMQRFWTGVGPLDYAGNTWTGLGMLGAVAPVKYTVDLAIQELSFTLSGVPADALTWLSNDVRNRTADVWLAALDRHGNIVADPYQIVAALLDYQTFSVDESGNATLTLIGRSGFYTLERALDEVHSAEDQRRQYPDDSGLDLIPELQQQEVIWSPS